MFTSSSSTSEASSEEVASTVGMPVANPSSTEASNRPLRSDLPPLSQSSSPASHSLTPPDSQATFASLAATVASLAATVASLAATVEGMRVQQEKTLAEQTATIASLATKVDTTRLEAQMISDGNTTARTQDTVEAGHSKIETMLQAHGVAIGTLSTGIDTLTTAVADVQRTQYNLAASITDVQRAQAELTSAFERNHTDRSHFAAPESLQAAASISEQLALNTAAVAGFNSKLDKMCSQHQPYQTGVLLLECPSKVAYAAKIAERMRRHGSYPDWW